MGFKLPGKSIQSGTSSHRSALKMKASPVKRIGKKGLYASDKSWAEGVETSKDMGGNLNEWVRQRKRLKIGTPEWNKVQNKINEALGNKKRYPVTTKTVESKPKTTKKSKEVKPETKKSEEVKPETKIGEEVKEETPSYQFTTLPTETKKKTTVVHPPYSKIEFNSGGQYFDNLLDAEIKQIDVDKLTEGLEYNPYPEVTAYIDGKMVPVKEAMRLLLNRPKK